MAYLMAIDVGSTSVKVSIFDSHTLEIVVTQSQDLEPPVACERTAESIVTKLEGCLDGFDGETLQSVGKIGMCGQMHGCVLWKKSAQFISEETGSLAVPSDDRCSLFITWQDGRCTPDFLGSLPRTEGSPIRSGFGCATLAWLQRHQPATVKSFDAAGTIMDLLVCALTASPTVKMSTHLAASWGYFNTKTLDWEKRLLASSDATKDFPLHLLPEVVAVPHVAGSLAAGWHGIKRGTPIGVAMGDLQCAVRAAGPDCDPGFKDLVLNIGTASQLALIALPGSSPDLPPSLEEVPYFDGCNLVVAAALAGGNAIATLASMLTGWLARLGLHKAQEEIYAAIVSSAGEKLDTTLRVSPNLWGERHWPQAKGAVSNITVSELSLGDVASATLRGVVDNLKEMMTDGVLEKHQASHV